MCVCEAEVVPFLLKGPMEMTKGVGEAKRLRQLRESVPQPQSWQRTH